MIVVLIRIFCLCYLEIGSTELIDKLFSPGIQPIIQIKVLSAVHFGSNQLAFISFVSLYHQ